MKKQILEKSLFFILLCWQSGCNNYDLDNKIRAALNGNGNGSSTAPQAGFQLTNISGGTYDGLTINYTLSNTVKFSATVIPPTGVGAATMILDTSTLPPFITASLNSSGIMQIGAASGGGFPPISSTLAIKFFLSLKTSASSLTLNLPITINLKKVFATSGSYQADKSTWTSFGCGGIVNDTDKASCLCQGHASANNLYNAKKMRAYISGSAGDARCSITGKPTLVPGQLVITDLSIGGSGYSTPPAVSVTGLSGCASAPSVTAVIANGAVVDLIVNNPGAGCAGSPTITFTPALGGVSALGIVTSASGCNITSTDGGPWYNMNFQLVANNMSGSVMGGLLGNSLMSPISVSELGGAITNVWTGSVNNGTGSGSNCTNWGVSPTATYGLASSPTVWVNSTTSTCSSTFSFYCFESD